MAWPHIYKRGEIFWFRRRIPNGRDVVAFSLGTRDPRIARAVGRQLAAAWDTIVQTTLSADDIAHALKGPALRRHLQDAERLRADIKHARKADEFDRRRFLSERRAKARVFSALTELASQHGPGCEFSSEIEGAYRSQGYGSYELGLIEDKIRKGYVREMFRFGSEIAGTPKIDDVQRDLGEIGACLSCSEDEHAFLANFARVRAAQERQAAAAYEEALSNPVNVLRKSAPRLDILRHDRDPSPPPYHLVDAIERGEFIVANSAPNALVLSDRVAAPLKSEPEALEPQERPVVQAAEPVVPPEEIHADGHEPPAPLKAVKTLDALVAALAVEKRKDWKEKTAQQHVQASALLAKVAGTGDLKKITQVHVGLFRDVLNQLPATHGKSSKDQHLSLAQILERAAKSPDTPRLKPGTINRWITQLSTILEAAQMRGFGPYDIAALNRSRPKDYEPVEEKRGAFTDEMVAALLSHATWRNLEAPIAPSLYWAPLIGLTTGARLGEILALTPADIDFSKGTMRIQTGKSAAAARDIPIHDELLRLGFRAFVERRSTPTTLLFHDLRERGEKTAPTSLFYKKFSIILSEAVPTARDEKFRFTASARGPIPD